MKTRRILNDLLARVTGVGRLLALTGDASAVPLEARCGPLLAGSGEATGLALAAEILERYTDLARDGKRAFFQSLREKFGVDPAALAPAVDRWRETGSDEAARALHFAAEPRTQERVRRLNRVPGGTISLVAMRPDLLAAIRAAPDLKPLDDDFSHLFASWFNRGSVAPPAYGVC